MTEPFETPFLSYDSLSKWDSPSWDDTTREVVRKRLEEVPAREYLQRDEWETLEAVCARVVPQPDRPGSPVPIVPFIDRKLSRGGGPGYRYENMPPLRMAWRLGIAGIEKEARSRHHQPFIRLTAAEQDEILRAIQEETVEGDLWKELPPGRFFTHVLLETVVGIYYAHPAAWNETGFGGPASPRGYVRREIGGRDAWEADEEWNPVTRAEEGE